MRFLPARIASLVLLGLTLGASAAPSLEPYSAELGSRGFRMTPTPKSKPAPEVVPRLPKTFKNRACIFNGAVVHHADLIVSRDQQSSKALAPIRGSSIAT